MVGPGSTTIPPVPANATPEPALTPAAPLQVVAPAETSDVPNDNSPHKGKTSRTHAYLKYNEEEFKKNLQHLVIDATRWARGRLDMRTRVVRIFLSFVLHNSHLFQIKLHKSFLKNNPPVPRFLDEVFVLFALLSVDQVGCRDRLLQFLSTGSALTIHTADAAPTDADPMPTTTPFAKPSRADTNAAAPRRTYPVRSSGDAQVPAAARPSPQSTPHDPESSQSSVPSIETPRERTKSNPTATTPPPPLDDFLPSMQSISYEELLQCHNNIMELTPAMGYGNAADFLRNSSLSQLRVQRATLDSLNAIDADLTALSSILEEAIAGYEA